MACAHALRGLVATPQLAMHYEHGDMHFEAAQLFSQCVKEMQALSVSGLVVRDVLLRTQRCLRLCEADEHSEALEVRTLLDLVSTWCLSAEQTRECLVRFEQLVPGPESVAKYGVGAVEMGLAYLAEAIAIILSFDHCSLSAGNSFRHISEDTMQQIRDGTDKLYSSLESSELPVVRGLVGQLNSGYMISIATKHRILGDDGRELVELHAMYEWPSWGKSCAMAMGVDLYCVAYLPAFILLCRGSVGLAEEAHKAGCAQRVSSATPR